MRFRSGRRLDMSDEGSAGTTEEGILFRSGEEALKAWEEAGKPDNESRTFNHQGLLYCVDCWKHPLDCFTAVQES